jgi:hypothetical protein
MEFDNNRTPGISHLAFFFSSRDIIEGGDEDES